MGIKWVAPDLINKKFGRLTVVTREPNINGRSVWKCICDCGNIKITSATNFKQKKVLSCGCLDKQSRSDRHKLRPYEALYRVLLRVASSRKHEMGLTYEEFLEFTKINECHYCDKELVWKEFLTNKGTKGGYNLDRIDNTGGYSKANCVACCGICNQSRADRFTYAEWKQIGNLIKTWRTSGS